MKSFKLLILSTALLLCGIESSSAAVLVTGFGSGQFTSTYSDFTNTQTATTFQIVGLDNGSLLSGSLPSTVDITGNTSLLQLTATYTSASTATSVFQIDLFDSSGNDRLYQANLSGFSPRDTPVTLNFNFVSQTGAFNNLVSTIAFYTGGTGSSLNLTMDTLTANSSVVPEPSTNALLACGAIGLVWFLEKRRRFVLA